MITLIAESKTMTACDKVVTSAELKHHLPKGEANADRIMEHIAGMSAMELASVAKFSGAMAVKALKMAYEFPNKALGERAIEAFTGVVFRAFDYTSLSEEEKMWVETDIRIISSLYGWLRPDDIVKAYRLDYNSPLSPGDNSPSPGDKPLSAGDNAPSPGDKPLSADDKPFSSDDKSVSPFPKPLWADDKPMWSFWKKDATISLVKEIKERNGEAVLNLLPGDAAKMIDWKLVKNFAKVWKVDFKELLDGGGWKTPTANRLKELRGHLLREIVMRRLESPRELLTLETDLLLPLGTPDYSDHIAFCVK